MFYYPLIIHIYLFHIEKLKILVDLVCLEPTDGYEPAELKFRNSSN